MRTRRFGRTQRGAAMVEAVIVIPVLILLWVSLYYAGGLALTQQRTEATARSCAWLYSANSCDESKVPAGCQDYVHNTHASTIPPKIADTLNQGAQNAMNGGDAKGIVGSIVGSLVMAPLAAAFTNAVDARVEQQMPQPAAYGGGIKVVTGQYHLPCNLAHDTPAEMAGRAWRKLVGQ